MPGCITHSSASWSKLARSHPQTTIILNHVGGVLGIGPYAGLRDQVFADWRKSIERLAQCPNVYVKLGGLGMRLFGFDVHTGALPPSSQQLADAWRPYIETCIEAFGVKRSMFESNFPVDKGTCSYQALWNAFKRIAAGASSDEKDALFAGTAMRVYRLEREQPRTRKQALTWLSHRRRAGQRIASLEASGEP